MTISKAFQETGLLTTKQAAGKLGVSRSAVWIWIRDGLLEHQRVGAFLGITEADLNAFQASWKHGTDSSAKNGAKSAKRRKAKR